MEPIINNAADERELGEAKQKIGLAKNSEKNEIKALLTLKAFRKFMYQFVSRCDSLGGFKASGSEQYYESGQLNVCRKIKAQLVESDPEAVLLMMKEGTVDFK